MNHTEKEALKLMHIKIAENIDPLFLRGYLYQEGGIGRTAALETSKICVRQERAEDFLLQIVDECSMKLFLDALTYGGYEFLVPEIQQTIEKIESRGVVKKEKDDICNSQTSLTAAINSVPNTVNVFTKRRQKVMRYNQLLKKISHNGNHEQLSIYTGRILKKWKKFKKLQNVSVGKKHEMADLVFMAYDSGVANRRLKYDSTLYKGSIFEKMLRIIPFTSEPKVSCMTYLARYGSAIAMKEPLENGLTYLQFARQHADGISPGYETGMVFYIELNLLAQKYQEEPDKFLKTKIVRLAEEAISHYGEEDQVVSLNYKRMLLLKIAFVHLGIGLFGESMDVDVSFEDLKAAKNCLDFVEEPDLWKDIETRRKMFFYIAKSKYYEFQKQPDLALDHAKKAKELAEGGKFLKELPNIENSISLLSVPSYFQKETNMYDIEKVLGEFLDEFPDED